MKKCGHAITDLRELDKSDLEKLACVNQLGLQGF